MRKAVASTCAGDPDPKGERVKVVTQALIDNPHIEAIFWDVREHSATAPLHEPPHARARCTTILPPPQ